MADGGEGSQELMVKGGVAGLSVGQLPGAGQVVPQELKFRNGNYTLGEADDEPLESEQLKNQAEVLYT